LNVAANPLGIQRPRVSLMKKFRDVTECDRPRERIASRGAASLSDIELISAIIGSGSRDRDVFAVAKDIADRLSDDPGQLTYHDLIEIGGIGKSNASKILACFELGRRYYKTSDAVKVSSPEDLLPLVSDLANQKQEHFICITLNGANEIIAKRTITVGLLNHSLVHPREVFADAISDRAASVICVHNHPSNTLEPSSQDIAVTRQLADAGNLLGIRLLDHLIIAKGGFVSMKERGLL
jgi:DNA repair protein RadC